MQHGKANEAALGASGGDVSQRPAMKNSAAGYDAYQAALTADTPVTNKRGRHGEFLDAEAEKPRLLRIMEIKNISMRACALSIIFPTMRRRWIYGLPDDACTGRERYRAVRQGKRRGHASFLHAPFELDSTAEGLYLSDRSGRVRDCAFLHDIPYGGSMGA